MPIMQIYVNIRLVRQFIKKTLKVKIPKNHLMKLLQLQSCYWFASFIISDEGKTSFSSSQKLTGDIKVQVLRGGLSQSEEPLH